MSFDNPTPSPPSRKATSAGAIRAEIDRLNAKTADVNLETAELRLKTARHNAAAAESDRKTRRNLRIMDIAMIAQGAIAVAMFASCFFLADPPTFLFVQSATVLFLCTIYTAVDRKILGTPVAILSSAALLGASIPIIWQALRGSP